MLETRVVQVLFSRVAYFRLEAVLIARLICFLLTRVECERDGAVSPRRRRRRRNLNYKNIVTIFARGFNSRAARARIFIENDDGARRLSIVR